MRVVAVLMAVLLLAGRAAAQAPEPSSARDPQPAPVPADGQAGAPQTDPAPTHVSTSWKSLIRDSAGDYWHFPQRKSTWIILGVGAGAALAAHAGDSYVETHIVGNRNANRIFKLGKVIGSTEVEVGSAVAVWAIGRYFFAPAADEPRTNKVSALGFDLLRAEMLSQGIVQTMKHVARRDRPTGECCAFPSGHAATAFAVASVLERHLGYRGSWPFLVGAMYVGASRLVDNKHFLSDVVFGAAVGTASGWTVVGRGGPNEIQVAPRPVDHGLMIQFSRVPHAR